MAIIYSYPVASAVEAGDLLIGTDITGKQTKNFTIQSIIDLLPAEVNGTVGTIPVFTGLNSIGDSIITQDSNKNVKIGENDAIGNSKLNVFRIEDMTTSSPHIATFNESYSNHSANLWPNPGDNPADIYGSVSRASFTGSGSVDQIIGINPVGRHSGSGSVNFIQGVQISANLTGAGSAGTMIASYAKVNIFGTANTEITDAIAANNVLDLNGSNTVQNAFGTYTNLFLTEGEVSNVAVGHYIDFDQVSATTQINNAYYIRAEDDSLNVSGEKLFIKDTTGLNSEFGANLTIADSLEVGSTSQATGSTSLAAGSNTLASGTSSTAMGSSTIASGVLSTAMGRNTTASGITSVAMGDQTTASSVGSIATGYKSIASGDCSFAGGGFPTFQFPVDGGIAYGSNSFAFGSNAIAGEVSGNMSGDIAIGVGCEADGGNSVALGNNTKATNNNSFTAGVGNLASGVSSTALGSVTVASGSNSFACGDNTTASGGLSFASGKGNVASGDGSIVMGGIGTGISTAAGTASSVFGGLQNTANGTNSTIVGGQKNNIDVNSSDSGIIGGEDNEMTSGSTNSILLGGIGLRGGGINQTVVGVANVSRNDAKFIVGVGEYTNSTTITRENAFVVKDDGQIVLDQYTSNDFLSNTYTFPVLNLDGSGKINKGNLADMLPEVPPEMKNTSHTFQSGSNVNLGASTKGIVIASWTVVGSNNPATITLPQSSNNLNKLITVVTSASFGNVGSTNILGIKPAFGDTINDTTAPNSVIYLDKAYESAEFYATSDGWIMLRKTII
jgi:hypothetical protein